MTRFLSMLFALLVACLAPAQERRATVQLDDGKVLAGTVLAMDLSTLQMQVGHEVVTLPAARIKSCRFDASASAESDGPVGENSAAATPAPAGAGANESSSPSTAGEKQDPSAGDKAPSKPRITWKQPLPDPVDPEAAAELPHDLRRTSRLRARLEALDQKYPWLEPTAPTQWVSLGLLLAIASTLVVHLSVRFAGAEAAGTGRCFGLTAWYLLTGFLQVAMVPVNDLSVTLMLLANTTMALFWVGALFALPRVNALIAFAIQLGFVAFGWGVLELVTALLGSVGVRT